MSPFVNGSYFAQVRDKADGYFWVNNPTQEELARALTAGAVGCTTNPAYGGNLARRSPGEIRPIVADVVSRDVDDDRAVELVQQRLVARIADRLMPLYESSHGRQGFVSLQGSPELDDSVTEIMREAHEAREIAPNVAPKIPATRAGLKAMEALVEDGHPVIVTEVFSLAQLVATVERWLQAANGRGVRPAFFISPITGIFGDYLKKVAERDALDVADDDIEMAGVVLARRCYQLVRERKYPPTLLYGGARTPVDFTGLVGRGMAATINWSTAADLIEAAPDVRESIGEAVDVTLEERLVRVFPDVRLALRENALELDDFEAFGPVQHFRESFLVGWRAVRSLVTEAHGAAPPVGQRAMHGG